MAYGVEVHLPEVTGFATHEDHDAKEEAISLADDGPLNNSTLNHNVVHRWTKASVLNLCSANLPNKTRKVLYL